MATRQDLERYRADPYVQQMLTLLSRTEGTYDAKNPYAVYGGKVANQLTSFADHPRAAGKWGFQDNSGKQQGSTAAGRYQIIQKTWDGISRQYGLNDFSPMNQDLAAIGLMVNSGVMPLILKGDIRGAASKLGNVWASLPSSPYNQAKRSGKEFDRMLAATTGVTAPTELPSTAGAVGGMTDKSIVTPKIPSPTAPTTRQDFVLDPLSKDELEAIMTEKRPTQPRIKDDFFVNVAKPNWAAYYS